MLCPCACHRPWIPHPTMRYQIVHFRAPQYDPRLPEDAPYEPIFEVSCPCAQLIQEGLEGEG